MKYVIDIKSHTPAYQQLYLQVREDIIKGIYPMGSKLPSKRTIAMDSNTSTVTVEHAYSLLIDEGYIESRERSGFFVIFRADDGFVTAPIQNHIHDLPLSSHTDTPTDFPFSVLAKTMRNVISKYGENILVKSPNAGCTELRKAISDYLARGKGINVSYNQIVIGSGAEYLYGLIVQFLGRDKIYALENPSYEKIHSVYIANGAKCDLLKLGRDGILTSQLTKTKASVLHITPFRSFPSGITASASKRNEYIKWANDRKAVIIEDDFNSEFTVSTKNEDTVFSLEPVRSVIYVNTFTKTIAPSMRIGYMVLPEELVKPFFDKMGFYSCTVPIFDQYVLAEFISNGDFERHINRTRRKLRQINKNK